jgi:hypothetical protein
MAKEQNCQNNIQTFDAIKLEKLYKMVRGNKKPCDTQTNLPKFSAFSFKAHKIQYNIPTVYISEIHCCIFKNINLPTILPFCKKNPL